MNLLGYNINLDFKLNNPVTWVIVIVVVMVTVNVLGLKKNQEGFTDSNGKKLIVLFYAPWCGHCKKMMPEWDKLAAKLQGDPSVEVVKVNSDEEVEKAKKEGVQTYPTIMMYKDGNKVPYKGERTAEAIEQFVSAAQINRLVPNQDNRLYVVDEQLTTGYGQY